MNDPSPRPPMRHVFGEGYPLVGPGFGMVFRVALTDSPVGDPILLAAPPPSKNRWRLVLEEIVEPDAPKEGATPC